MKLNKLYFNKQIMKYIPLEKLKKEIIKNDYNKWAIAMLELISNFIKKPGMYVKFWRF